MKNRQACAAETTVRMAAIWPMKKAGLITNYFAVNKNTLILGGLKFATELLLSAIKYNVSNSLVNSPCKWR